MDVPYPQQRDGCCFTTTGRVLLHNDGAGVASCVGGCGYGGSGGAAISLLGLVAYYWFGVTDCWVSLSEHGTDPPPPLSLFRFGG